MDDLRKLVHQHSTLDYKRRKKLSEWLAFATKDKVGPRDKLALHTASINVFLMTLSHGSLGRLEFLAKHARPSPSSLVPPSPMSENNATIYSGTRGVGEAHDSTGFSIWEALGKDLYEEGITHQQIEKHQEELKAYLRYLVKGETPFWNSKSSEARFRCESPSYRCPPALPTSRSILQGLERHRKERDIKQRGWTGAASTGQYARGEFAPDIYKLEDLECGRRAKKKMMKGEQSGKSAIAVMERKLQNEVVASTLEVESMQEHLLQELKIWEAKFESGKQGLKVVAAKKDFYAMRLRRSTKSTQKRKLQKKFDEVKRQFLEQEVEVERAKEGVAQRRIRLEEMKLEQAMIDVTNRSERVCKGESPSESDHRIPIHEPASRDDEVEYLLHEFQSLFDLDEDADLDYNLETEVASPSSAYTDSLASQDYSSEEDVVSNMPSEDSTGPNLYNESPPAADKTTDRALTPPTVERILLSKAALDGAIDKRNRSRRHPNNQRIIEQIETRDIPNYIAELKKLGCRFTCDICDMPIAGPRFHCDRCEGGDWDSCEACWDMKGRSHRHEVRRFKLEDDTKNKVHVRSLYPGSFSG